MGKVTEEQIQEILDDMILDRAEDKIGFYVFFDNVEASDKWFKDLNEEMKRQFYENYGKIN